MKKIAMILTVFIVLFAVVLSCTPKPAPISAPPQPAPPQIEVELKYDDGKARGYLSAGPKGGYLIDFKPSTKSFIIKKVRLYGKLVGSDWEEKNFKLAILDKDFQLLDEVIQPVTKFSVHPATSWVEVEIPEITVTDKFYILVYTGTGKGKGIHLGVDDSIINKHSDHIVSTPEGTFEISTQWPYSQERWFGDKSKVNWMIRVVGVASDAFLTATPPKLKEPISDFTWEGKYAGEEIRFSDKSRNATSWYWDFGDGIKSNEQHPRHSYKSPGVYLVTLLVENPAGSAKKTQKVLVFEKGGVWLVEVKMPEITEVGKTFKTIVTFLADEGVEILMLYRASCRKGGTCPMGTHRPFKIGKIDYGPPGKLIIFGASTKTGSFTVECYVEYKASDGTIKKSNTVSTDYVVK